MLVIFQFNVFSMQGIFQNKIKMQITLNESLICFLECVYVGTMFLFIYIYIKLKCIIMETPLSNLVDSSFKHVLHSYGFHLISTYKYEIGNFFFILHIIYWIIIYHLFN